MALSAVSFEHTQHCPSIRAYLDLGVLGPKGLPTPPGSEPFSALVKGEFVDGAVEP